MKKILVFIIFISCSSTLYAKQIIFESYIGVDGYKKCSGVIIQDFIIHSSIAFPSVDVGFYFNQHGYLYNKMAIGLSCYKDVLSIKNTEISIYSSVRVGLVGAVSFLILPSIGININIYNLNISSQLNFYQKDFTFKDNFFNKDIVFAIGFIY